MKNLLIIGLLALLPNVLLAQSKLGVSIYSGATPFGAFGSYAETYDIEIGFKNTSNDSSSQTSYTTTFSQINMKSKINDNNQFLYGILIGFLNGKVLGVNVSQTQISILIGLESEINQNLKLRALYYPFETITSIGNSTVRTTQIGQNAVIGVSYLF